jgi:hypothetical protein
MLFALCFAAAWAATVLLAGGIGNGRRLWWAWPIHVAFIVWFLGSLKRRPALVLTLVAFVAITCNQVLLSHLSDWHHNGWSGKDAGVFHLLDVAYAMERPTETMAIGYVVTFPAWFPEFWKIDRDY